MVKERATTTEEKFIPAEELIVGNLDTLKVLADPLRMSILEYLYKPATVKQIAQKIGKPPTKLYYHFNLLEKHHLIKMVDTRIVSGIIEKHYQVAAKTYRPAPGLLSPGTPEYSEGLDVALTAMFDSAREDLRTSLEAGVIQSGDDKPLHRRLVAYQARLALTDEEAQEFYQRVYKLMSEYEKDDDDLDNATAHKLFVMLHPSSWSGADHTEENDT
jgi:DNA-binding transcriptional ArsR family regulator